ncbi:MAG: radical SAM family heme chaperone HemW [Bacteroidaceae bacterium]|nr:radical SAM family heme chaperone HemW [Bacteroidaceae bacterium]
MTGVYIHIPFCKSRCVYCDFASSTLGDDWKERYLAALAKEMERRCHEHGDPRARTIYIGGGTPSQLSPALLIRLFDHLARHFSWPAEAEITLEANPDDVTDDFGAALKDTPVNRVSMGVQSTDDHVLSFLRRRHTAQQAVTAVYRLQDAGYTNLSLDLIYGLPGQSLTLFEQDVRRVLSLDIPHLSAYALQFEEGTVLWQMRQRGEVKEADEELSLQCYHRLINLTAEAGLGHYEISNFARPDFRSRHNSSYWQGLPYLGLGAGAHSYDGHAVRTANCPDVQRYIAGEAAEVERLSANERFNERIMLSLRTREGLDLHALERDFGRERRRACERQAAPHVQEGRLRREADRLRLTLQGLFVSDAIIVDLMN